MQLDTPTHPPEADDPWGLEVRASDEVAPVRVDDIRRPSATLLFTPLDETPSETRHLPRSLVVTGVLIAVAASAWLVRSATTPAPAPAVVEGVLIVSSHPSGATVRIDGADAGTTPLGLSRAVGRYTVEVAAAGATPQQFVADVVGGETWRRHVEFAPPTRGAGALRVETTRPGVEVRLDGLVVGRTPLALDDLPTGLHSVQVLLPSGTVTRDVTIEPGLTATLVMGGSGSAIPGVPQSAWLVVTVPFEVQVFEAGRLLGVSRSEQIMVAAGAHELDFVNERLGYKRSHSVTIQPGRTATVELDVPVAPVAINALPWAEVTIDGQAYGETPVASARLPIGNHRVVLRHPTLGERTESIVVGLGGANRLSVDLRR